MYVCPWYTKQQHAYMNMKTVISTYPSVCTYASSHCFNSYSRDPVNTISIKSHLCLSKSYSSQEVEILFLYNFKNIITAEHSTTFKLKSSWQFWYRAGHPIVALAICMHTTLKMEKSLWGKQTKFTMCTSRHDPLRSVECICLHQ